MSWFHLDHHRTLIISHNLPVRRNNRRAAPKTSSAEIAFGSLLLRLSISQKPLTDERGYTGVISPSCEDVNKDQLTELTAAAAHDRSRGRFPAIVTVHRNRVTLTSDPFASGSVHAEILL